MRPWRAASHRARGALWYMIILAWASQGATGVRRCLTRGVDVAKIMLQRNDELETVLERVCDHLVLCQPEVGNLLDLPEQEKTLIRDQLHLHRKILDEQPSLTGIIFNLEVDRTARMEVRHHNTSWIVRLPPSTDASLLAAIHGPRLGLRSNTMEYVNFERMIREGLARVDAFCDTGLDLVSRARAASYTSQILSPGMRAAVRSLVQNSTQGIARNSSWDGAVEWVVKSPKDGALIARNDSSSLQLNIVVRAHDDMEIEVADMATAAGVNLTVLLSVDREPWKIFDAHEVRRVQLDLPLGQHMVLFQLFDQNDTPVSHLMASSVRRGPLLSELDAPPLVNAFYSLYPERLFERAQFYLSLHVHEVASNSWQVAVAHVEPNEVPQPSEPLRLLRAMELQNEKFIGFHTMQGGLNNQITEFAGMVWIANALGRTLVLPKFLSGDLTHPAVELEFEQVFDVDALRQGLAGFARVHGGGSASSALFASLPATPTSIDVPVWYKGHMSLDFFRRLLLDCPERANMPYVVLKGGYGAFSAHRSPHLLRQVRHALQFTSDVHTAAAKVIAGIHSLTADGDTGYLAVHTRVERDWHTYALNRERAAGVEGVRYWFSADEIASRVSRHPDLATLQVVYLAVGPGMLEDPRPIFRARLGPGVRAVVTKSDLAPEVAIMPYTQQSAVDMLVCEMASAFVGTSHSTFTNAIAEVFEARGKVSYLYNLPGDEMMVRERTDGGRMVEPHDATFRPPTIDAVLADQACRGMMSDVAEGGQCIGNDSKAAGLEEQTQSFLSSLHLQSALPVRYDSPMNGM